METSGTLRFESNVPVDVALQYASGKPVTSGVTKQEQMMYTLADGRRMYLDLDVAVRVDALQLGRGEAFTICKIGKGKDTQWAVGRAEGGIRQTSTPVGRECAAKPADSPEQVLARTLMARRANTITNALKAAVSAADQAEKYAKSLGFTVAFTTADITQLAEIAARMQACQ